MDTSKPVGAVTVTLATRLAPEILTNCAADAVPAQVLKALKLPVALMVGLMTATVNPVAVDTQPVVVFLTVMLKL